MKPKILSIVLIFSLALNLAVVGTFIFRKMGAPDRRDGFPPFDHQRMPFFERMHLNNDQHNEMTKLVHDFRQINKENRLMILDLEDQLFQMMRDEESDSLKIDSLINTIGQLRIEQSKQAVKHFRRFNRFLSPEQQAHFHQMIMDRPAREGRLTGWKGSRERRKMGRQNYDPDSLDNRD